jgi:hypothetical protein
MESSALLFLVPAAALIGVAIIVKAIIENWTKMRGKEMGSIESDASAKSRDHERRAEIKRLISNLKWSLILIGIGLPMALSYFFESLRVEAILGLMLLFAGLGLFLYFFLAKRMLDQMREKNQE